MALHGPQFAGIEWVQGKHRRGFETPAVCHPGTVSQS